MLWLRKVLRWEKLIRQKLGDSKDDEDVNDADDADDADDDIDVENFFTAKCNSLQRQRVRKRSSWFWMNSSG